MKSSCFLRKHAVFTGILLLSIFISFGSAFAAGFALIEQGVSGLGNAYSGGAASAEDATTIFFNPAGMTRLNGQQAIVGAHVIMPSVKFKNSGSTHVLGGALAGGDGGEGGVTKLVPNIYYGMNTGNLAFGLGINAPFGLATKYDKDWVGRYHGIESDMLTLNINPSVAYKMGDLSIGAGVSAQYLKAKLSSGIDFGSAMVISLGAPTATALGLSPQNSDLFVELEGDSWGYGYNFGLLYEISKNIRAGASYRSRVKHTLKGDADYSALPSAVSTHPVVGPSVNPKFQDGTVKADITLPDSASVSLFYQISQQWMIMADYTWTNWSVFKELRVDFDNPNQADSVTTEEWQDNHRYSLGLTFAPDDKLTFRTGVAYDTAAVPSKERRTPRIPDSDRTWVALGMGYKITKALSFDLGYAHLFINEPEMNKTAAGEDALRGGLKGTFDASINIVSAQLNLVF
jgi:long-chain fatty acid transport protein